LIDEQARVINEKFAVEESSFNSISIFIENSSEEDIA